MKKIKFFPFYALSRMPMPVLYFLSDVLFGILYHLIRYRRKVVSHNLKRAFPDKSQPEINHIERGFYRHFCDLMAETLKALTISGEEAGRRLQVKNPELIEKYYREGRSIILYAAHQGNWEWLGFLPRFLPHQVTSFYKPLSSAYFNDLALTIRERFGTICIEANKGFRTLLELERKGIVTLNMIIGDQTPIREHQKLWTDFLNQETAFLTGAERIARKSNQVSIFSFFRKKARGVYELEFKLIAESSAAIPSLGLTESYARLLEDVIMDAPELWLWSHRRWKLTKPAGDEPAPEAAAPPKLR